MSESKSSLGFIGLGTMGGRMARNLLQAGYPLVGFDTDPVRLDGCAKDGAQRATSARDVAERCDFVLTSLPSSDVTVQVYEESLLPAARSGQIFIDHGITRATDTRRLAERCWDRGAELIDAPVSGSLAEAEGGVLRIMIGGAEPAVARCRPILEHIGDPDKITYCGPSERYARRISEEIRSSRANCTSSRFANSRAISSVFISPRYVAPMRISRLIGPQILSVNHNVRS